MKSIFKATAIVAALAAAGSATAMTVTDNGGQFDTLVSELTNVAQSPDTWANRVRGNHENPTVRIIGLSEVGAAGAALNGYLDGASVDLSDFRRAVNSHPVLATSLFADGFDASDVVAYKGFGKNSIELYVDDIR